MEGYQPWPSKRRLETAVPIRTPNPERYWRWYYLKVTGFSSPKAKRKAAALFLAKQEAQTLALFPELKARTPDCHTFLAHFVPHLL